MKLTQILPHLLQSGNDYAPVITAIQAKAMAAGIPADIFWPVVQSSNYGIRRKLAALASMFRHQAPEDWAVAQSSAITRAVHGFDGTESLVPPPWHFAKIGNHQNILAGATERALCAGYILGQRLAKVQITPVAIVKAECRHRMRVYMDAVRSMETAPTKTRLAAYKASLAANAEPWGSAYRAYLARELGVIDWHPGAGCYGHCPPETRAKWTLACKTGQKPVDYYFGGLSWTLGPEWA